MPNKEIVSYGGPPKVCAVCKKRKSWHICEYYEGHILCNTCAWEAKHGRVTLPPAPATLLQEISDRFELLTLLGLSKDRLLASF